MYSRIRKPSQLGLHDKNLSQTKNKNTNRTTTLFLCLYTLKKFFSLEDSIVFVICLIAIAKDKTNKNQKKAKGLF